ncbi:MAG: hypothetical protein JW841_03655 [Deltaproteobacteria bacterium]|nr:hypothetical protein [Deltaproteobacteria bacterium]
MANSAIKKIVPKPVGEKQNPAKISRFQSNNLIYRTMMRCGGAAFGAPFEIGLSSLTVKIVKFFRQLGFFGFETIEKTQPRNQRNKFTMHGAAPFVGDYQRRSKRKV